MKINLYVNYADKRKVDKSNDIKEIVTKTLFVKDTIDLINPIVVLEYGDKKFKFNYCYIEFCDRYYYIDKYEFIAGGKMILHLSIDVLMSWKSQIYNLTCLVKRQEHNANFKLVDSMLTAQNVTNVNCHRIGTSVLADSDYRYFLTVTGG